jgi:site-specific recombinase
LAECGDVCDAVLARLERAGVSVDVVYRLELIERSVARIELLLGVIVLRAPSDRARGAIELLAFLLEERRRDLSLVDIVRTTTHLLARKVIERAGDTGEHYITITRTEYFKMLASAAGGGVLTGFTAALKVLIGKLHRPLLQEGLLSSMNYAGSFLLMQLFGFTLATKQPSMTAAALAGALKLKKDSSDREAMVTMIARVIRSQLAAALGNVLLVIPSAFAIDWLWRWRFGEHLLTSEYSEKVVSSFHPTQSGTIPFAIITGVILWASSLSAGWLENWSAYRRLPEAIAEHRIRRVVGRKTTQWLSRVFAHNISGVGGNVSIGLMLGLTHSVGQFIGIPLDVRHVTLSTGSLTFAVLAQEGPPLATPGLVPAIIGIVIILALNLGVSFTLALIVALRAREVGAFEAFRLAGAVFIGFVKSPLRFFLPVESGDSHGHAA